MTVNWRHGWWLDRAPAVSCSSFGGALPAGKYYWEMTVNGADSANDGPAVGIANSSAELVSTFLIAFATPQIRTQHCNLLHARFGTNALGWGYPAQPEEGIAGGGSALGNVYGFALDTINKKIWWKNITKGTAWSGGSGGVDDPATNAFGARFDAGGPSPVTGNIHIIAGAPYDGATVYGKGTMNFGATAFAAAAPSGFVSVHSVAGASAAILNPNDNSNLTLTNGNLTFDALTRTGTGTALYGLANPDYTYGAVNCVRSVCAFAQA